MGGWILTPPSQHHQMYACAHMDNTPFQHGLHNFAIIQGVAADEENKFIMITSQTVTTAVIVEFLEFQFRLHLKYL